MCKCTSYLLFIGESLQCVHTVCLQVLAVVVAEWQMAPPLSFAQSVLMLGFQGLRRPADLALCRQTSMRFCRHRGATLWAWLEIS